jgi:hypothetical protein
MDEFSFVTFFFLLITTMKKKAKAELRCVASCFRGFVCLFVCNLSCGNSKLVARGNSAQIPTVWSPPGKGRRSLVPGTTISSLFGFPFWFEISDSEYNHESFVFLSWKMSVDEDPKKVSSRILR